MQTQNTTLVTFENHSVSGVDRMYGKFRMKIPGHSIGDNSVTLSVPDSLLDDVADYLKRNHPAITISHAAAPAAEELNDSGNTTDPDLSADDNPVDEVLEESHAAAPAAEALPSSATPPPVKKKPQGNLKKGGGRK